MLRILLTHSGKIISFKLRVCTRFTHTYKPTVLYVPAFCSHVELQCDHLRSELWWDWNIYIVLKSGEIACSTEGFYFMHTYPCKARLGLKWEDHSAGISKSHIWAAPQGCRWQTVACSESELNGYRSQKKDHRCTQRPVYCTRHAFEMVKRSLWPNNVKQW